MSSCYADGVNDIAPFYEHEDIIPQEIKDEIEATRSGLLDGSIEIPYIGEDTGW